MEGIGITFASESMGDPHAEENGQLSPKQITKLCKKYQLRAHFTCQQCGEVLEFFNQFLRHLSAHGANSGLSTPAESKSLTIIKSMNIKPKSELQHTIILKEQRVSMLKACEGNKDRSVSNENHKDNNKLGKETNPNEVLNEEYMIFPPVYACNRCPNVFSKTKSLKNHLALAHGLKRNSDHEHIIEQRDNNAENENKQLLDAKRIKTSEGRNKDSKHTGTDLPLPKTSPRSCKPNFQCRHCSKVFESHGGVYYHEATYHPSGANKAPFSCGHCEKKFAFLSHFKSHMKAKHPTSDEKNVRSQTKVGEAELRFSCKKCSRRFKFYSVLKRHELNHADRKYTCRYTNCPLKFKYYYELTRHLKAHTIKGDFTCEKCGRKFATGQALTTHTWKTHKSAFEERPRPLVGKDGKYACTYTNCPQRFKNYYKLNEHLKVHNMDGDFNCETCGRKFATEQALARHTWRIHKIAFDERPLAGNDGKYACTYTNCPQKFKDYYRLKTHLKVHNMNGDFNCETCGRKFATEQPLARHIWRIHKIASDERPLAGNDGKYACTYTNCPQKFKDYYRLKTHLKVHNMNGDFTCETCGRKFITRQAMAGHCLRVHEIRVDPVEGYECTVGDCPAKFKYYCKLQYHLKTHTAEGDFVCMTCGRKFTSHQAMAMHSWKSHEVKVDAAEESYFCSFEGCPAKFRMKNQLEEHLLHHNSEKLCHSCKACGRRFSTKPALSNHSWRSHRIRLSTPKVFSCKHCTKTFNDFSVFRIHQKTHDSNLKSFVCDICNKLFYGPRGLALHKRSEHSQDSANIFEDSNIAVETIKEIHCCEYCVRTFSNFKGKVAHKRTVHTNEYATEMEARRAQLGDGNSEVELNFSCDICSKRFAVELGLRVHKFQKHGPKKKFRRKPKSGIEWQKCPYSQCFKQFTHPSLLRNHIMTHTDERPHPCDLCDKKFRQKGQLRSHKQSVHHVDALTSPDSLMDNNVTRKEKQFNCEQCGVSFYFSRSWKFHMKTHDKKNESGEDDEDIDSDSS